MSCTISKLTKELSSSGQDHRRHLSNETNLRDLKTRLAKAYGRIHKKLHLKVVEKIS